MSATVSPASDGDHANKADEASETKPRQDKTLHIDMADDVETDIFYDFIPTFGDCAHDKPFWHNLTRKEYDVRELGAMSVRYISSKVAKHTACMPDRAGTTKIREAIWRALEELLPEREPPDFLPSIVFSHGPLEASGHRGIIDLVFPSSLGRSSYNKILASFRELLIKTGDDETTYFSAGYTNSLPGSILALDCHGLPVEDLDPQPLFEALKVLTAPAGVLIGFGKVVLAAEERGIHDQYCGFIRAYTKLHQENIAIPFHEFLQLLPTRFKCNGVAYGLTYPGSKHRKENVISSDFAVALVKEGRANGSEKRSSGATDEAESSSAAKKKRRSQK